jgi:hypothetical protein
MPTQEEIEAHQRALAKRGFKANDPYFHDCAACAERAVQKWTLQSKLGGRDIDLCLACGHARSWSRRRAGHEEREEEVGFDLAAFLR